MAVNLADAETELRRLSGLLDQALNYYGGQVKASAAAEEAYLLEKARAWVKYVTGTAAERAALVDAATAAHRRERDLAEGLARAGLKAIRSRRSQISAWQTLMAGHRSEAEFIRTGPEVRP